MNPLNNPKTLSQHFDKILFTIACSYLIIVIIWLFSQEKLRLPVISQPQPQAVPQNSQKATSDAQFSAYLLRSLQAIDRQLQANLEPSKPSPNSFPIKQTPVPIPVPSKLPSATSAGSTVIERVYIPIYPQNQPAAAVLPPKMLSAPPMPSPVPAKVPVLTPGASLPPTSVATSSSRNSLVGLLESGDQSAALFNLNGITQRIHIGEAIGTTGWILIAVENQKALIYRNGEKRLIDVGQSFSE